MFVSSACSFAVELAKILSIVCLFFLLIFVGLVLLFVVVDQPKRDSGEILSELRIRQCSLMAGYCSFTHYFIFKTQHIFLEYLLIMRPFLDTEEYT